MKPTKLQGIASTAFAVLALIVWGFVIWMACYVSTIILQTLKQIVDLAAISP